MYPSYSEVFGYGHCISIFEIIVAVSTASAISPSRLRLLFFCSCIEVPKEPPCPFLLPLLLAPAVRCLRKELDNVKEAHVVCNIDEDVVLSVEIGKLIDTRLRFLGILVHPVARRHIERLCSGLLRVYSLEYRTWTRWSLLGVRRRQWTRGYVLWQRKKLRGPEFSAMMSDISTYVRRRSVSLTPDESPSCAYIPMKMNSGGSADVLARPHICPTACPGVSRR